MASNDYQARDLGLKLLQVDVCDRNARKAGYEIEDVVGKVGRIELKGMNGF